MVFCSRGTLSAACDLPEDVSLADFAQGGNSAATQQENKANPLTVPVQRPRTRCIQAMKVNLDAMRAC